MEDARPLFDALIAFPVLAPSKIGTVKKAPPE
jgi:hypothetical protein